MRGTWQTTDNGGGGAGLIAVIILVLLIGSAVAKAVSAVLHTLVVIFEIAAYTALSLAGVAVLAGAGYLTWRIRARMLASRPAPRPLRAEVVQLAAEPVAAAEAAPERAALEAPQQRADGWPLPGWWEEVRPRVGRDDG